MCLRKEEKNMKNKMVKTQELTSNGQNILRVTLSQKDFDLPFKIIGSNKVAFLDVSGQADLIEHMADLLVEQMKEAGLEFDTILNPVSKSNALAHAIAIRWMKAVNPAMTSTVVARKAKPGEHHMVEAEYKSVTTNGFQTLYLTEDDAENLEGKKILLVDDVYGAGGTTRALEELIAQAKAMKAGHVVCAAEKQPELPEDLIYLYDLPSYPVKDQDLED